MSFDFSIYDYEDANQNEEEIPKKKTKTNVPYKIKESPKVTNFDFDVYDDYAPSEETTEPEREDTAGESAFRTAAQVPQGYLEGTPYGLATFGWQGLAMGETELDLEEEQRLKQIGERVGKPFNEEKYQEARGNALNSVPTVRNIASHVEEATGIPLTPKNRLQEGIRFGTSVAKGLPPPSKLVDNATGYTFRGLKKPLSRPIIGAGVAGTNEVLHAAGIPEPISNLLSFAITKTTGKGNTLNDFTKQRPKENPLELYPEAKRTLTEITPNERLKAPLGNPNQRAQNPINPERVTRQENSPIGLRPTPTRPTANDLQDQVGDIFSRDRFYNSNQGGRGLKNEIQAIDEEVYRGVGELYNNSRELNREISNIQPDLVGRLQDRIRELEAIPEPSDVQRRLIRAAERNLNRLAAFDENGNVTGYIPMNNQTMIDQIQSLRQIVDYDFAHGNTKNIFRPLINDFQEAAITTAEQAGRTDAAEALRGAQSGYRVWAENFDNDYVRPFRDVSNQDFSKLYKSALDLDESNMLRNVLQLSPEGTTYSNALTRDIVETKLSKYFENPRNVNARDFDKSLRELEAVITPQQTQQIRDQFRDASSRPNIRATANPKRPLSNDETIAAKYLDKSGTQIRRMMDDPFSIDEIRTDLATKKNGKQIFERLSDQKIRSILREGQIEKDFKGDDIYKLLNNEKNYEVFSAILGEAETEALRLEAKEIGKKQVSSEVKKAKLKNLAEKAIALKGLNLLLGLF